MSAASRREQREEFLRESATYLAAHPFCQIFIFRHELRESSVIAGGGTLHWEGSTIVVPRAVGIFHRNGVGGPRLLDRRWWIGASVAQASWIDRNKPAAMALGLLLPSATREGYWGGGRQGLATPMLLAKVARRG
jgi:hypothetical protein